MSGKSPGRLNAKIHSLPDPSRPVQLATSSKLKRENSDDEGKRPSVKRLKRDPILPAQHSKKPPYLSILPDSYVPRILVVGLKLLARGSSATEARKGTAKCGDTQAKGKIWKLEGPAGGRDKIIWAGKDGTHMMNGIYDRKLIIIQRPPNGFQPYNNISGDKKSTSSQYLNRYKGEIESKPFDLHGNDYSRRAQAHHRPSKRQRRDSNTIDTSISSNTIDLDTLTSPVDQQDNKLPLTNGSYLSKRGSTSSPGQKSTSLKVQEYADVESKMYVKKKRLRPSDLNPRAKFGASKSCTGSRRNSMQQFGVDTDAGSVASDQELKNDPIEIFQRSIVPGRTVTSPFKDPQLRSSSYDSNLSENAEHPSTPRISRCPSNSAMNATDIPSSAERLVSRNSQGEPSAKFYIVPDDVVDEDDSLDQLTWDHPTLNTSEMINVKQDKTSQQQHVSLSTRGDIARTRWSSKGQGTTSAPRSDRTERDTAGKYKDIFPISKIICGTEQYFPKIYDNPPTFHFIEETKTFKLYHGDGGVACARPSKYDIRLDKVTKLEYAPGSAKVCLSRRNDISIPHHSPKILLEFANEVVPQDFLQIFSQYKASPQHCEVDITHLNKIFLNGEKDTKFAKEGATVELPEDLALMQMNSERNSKRAVENARRSQMVNSSRHRGQLEIGPDEDRPPKQNLIQKLQGSFIPGDTAAVDPGPQRRVSARQSRLRGNGSLEDGQDLNNEEHGPERPSEILPRSSPPIPERWSLKNSHYKETWKHSLSWPTDSKKKVTVDKEDIERLDEGEFLNDNIIAFYLRYLEESLQQQRPKDFERIYFQNTFFYKTLSTGKGRDTINYESVKRWTKGDIFEKDYIIVPVNENFHWYLAIICHPGRLLRPNDATLVIEDGNAAATLTGEQGTEIAVPNRASGANSEEIEMISASNSSSLPILKSGSRPSSPQLRDQVEQMSLEDSDWPNDAEPRGSQPQLCFAQRPKRQKIDGPSDHGTLLDGDLSVQASNSEAKLIPKPVPGTPKAKKGKRKSTGPSRTCDPTQPRIITLDSLNNPHSPTCTRLRQWVIREAKEKRNIDIEWGHNSGKTAKEIPQQPNSCDCGIFLLAYVDKFLKDPDRFICDIVQGNMSADKDWPDMDASEMRDQLRSLILSLHGEQRGREKKLKQETRQVNDSQTFSAEHALVIDADEVEEVVNHSVSSDEDLSNSRKDIRGPLSSGTKACLRDRLDKKFEKQKALSTVELSSRALQIMQASPESDTEFPRSGKATSRIIRPPARQEETGSPSRRSQEAGKRNIFQKYANPSPKSSAPGVALSPRMVSTPPKRPGVESSHRQLNKNADEKVFVDLLDQSEEPARGARSRSLSPNAMRIADRSPTTLVTPPAVTARDIRSSSHSAEDDDVMMQSRKDRMANGTWKRKRKRAHENAQIID
ncbi:MAG: hypothetical protein M1818_002430 [Claussenomyces sp. TS43310]|nr:MAG: hypothetical protein M1818_002430 [Claussenomyces sp. TS43310]